MNNNAPRRGDSYLRSSLFLSSNAGLGYAPFASGTFGTLAGIPAFYFVSMLPAILQFVVTLLIVLISFRICDIAGEYYGEADDGRIVIDELAGYLLTTLFLPFSWGIALLAFVFFRIFDIVKPPPASWFDREVKNGIGVTMDDVMAGIYAAIVLRLWLWLFN
jgi:phosphatidylglycerophosphatase A